MFQRTLTLEFAFTATLAGIAGAYIIIATSYSATSRMAPLLIGVPVFVLLVVVLTGTVSPSIERLLSKYDPDIMDQIAEEIDEESDDGTPSNSINLWRALGWVIGIFVGFVLLGFLLMAPVCLFLYFKKEGDIEPRRAGTVALLLSFAFYLVFELMLGVSLYQGYIPTMLIEMLLSSTNV